MAKQGDEDSRIFEEAVLYWVHRVFHASRWTMYRLVLEAGASSPEEWLVMVFLWMRDGRTVAELCELMSRDRKTMTRIVANLEANGVVERHQGTENRATKPMRLSKRIREARANSLARFGRFFERAVEGIDATDLLVTRQTLQKMMANLKALDSER
jgi:DNA-binding MarR family transcriptional regulator